MRSGAVCLALVVMVGVVPGAFVLPSAASTREPHRTASVQSPPHMVAHAPLPCDFEENDGQTAAEVDYLARCSGYVAFLTKGDAVIRTPRDAFRVHVVGGHATQPAASIERPGRSNYLVGDDAKRWRTGIARFGRVEYAAVRPGVDVAYRTQGRAIAFDLHVAPGADTDALAIRLDGVAWAGPDADGNLSIGLASGGAARLSAPRAWQEIGGVRRNVTVAFAEGAARDEVGFRVGEFDRTRPLVIDPVLTVATYLGGSSSDYTYGIATDSSGAIYLAGSTSSTNYPTTTGALQVTKGEASTSVSDAFVTKLDSSGTRLVYSTFIGGNSNDSALCIAIDSSGRAHIGGATSSPNFPLQGAYQTSTASGFVAKLASNGASLTWSTYYDPGPTAIGLDSSGNVYGFNAGRVYVFDSGGTTVGYSVLLGGSSPPQYTWSAMAVDPSGAVWVGGRISSSNLATSGAYSNSFNGGTYDGFLVKLNASGSEVYRSYIGGNNDDAIRALALDGSGNVLVAGVTTSTNFPLVNAYQTSRSGQEDIFVTKLNSSASSAVFSTYLGGSLDDGPTDIAANSSGDVFVVGATSSTNFPTYDAFQSSLAGAPDAILAEFGSTGTIARSTYLGGSAYDLATGVAVSSVGKPLIAGYTASSGFPAACAYQSALSGTYDGFLAGIASGTATFTDLSPLTLPGATIGRDYSSQLTISGGTSPLAWTLHQGPLPAGLSLSTGGVLSGTPTATGTTSFFARIDDADNACAIREYRVTVNPVPSVPNAALPAWTKDRPYNEEIPVVGGTAPFAWQQVSGEVPPGTSVIGVGLLGGTPTATGDYTFGVSVVDAQGATASGTASVHIGAHPSIATDTLPEWTQNRPYHETIQGVDGTAPFTWSLVSGTLPIDKGIAQTTGVLDGTTLVYGDYTFTARLTDTAGATVDKTFTVHLNPWTQFTSPSLPIAVLGRPYAAGPATSGGTQPFVWSLTFGTLPRGFYGFGVATGVVSGTPTEAGRAPLGYRVTDGAGAVSDRSYALVVAPLEDVAKGRAKKEIVSILQEDSTEDVVRCIEAIAGTTLDLKLKGKGDGDLAVDLLLLDAAETPLDLTAFKSMKGKTLSVKGFPLPATGRYFVVLRPTPGFEGKVSLDVAVKAPGSPRGDGAVDPVSAPIAVPFAVLEGSKVVVSVKAAKGSLAVPTIASLKDAEGNELLVPEDLKLSAKGATLKVRARLVGGDYVATLAPGAGTAGAVTWKIAVKPPKGYRFALPELPVTGE